MENKSTKKENIANYYKAKFMKEKINEGYRKKAQKEIIENNYKLKTREENIKENYIKINQMKTINNTYVELGNEDIGQRLINNLAKRACKTMKAKGIIREFTHSELLGCDKDELIKHLSNLFDENMNLENYGDWQLDHIKPIASFNLNDENELKKCFNFKNVQPLWKEDNLTKSDNPNWKKPNHN
jgi:hypothetical protein